MTAQLEQSVVSEKPTRHAVVFSSGIRAIKHIASFLQVETVVNPALGRQHTLDIACVVVWGRKQNTARALQFAEARQLPVRYVEDGWIRSCSQNAHSRLSYSLLVDDTGVYYDSRSPSALENYLNLSDNEFDRKCGKDALDYAKYCRELMVDHGVTKYNYCRSANPGDLESHGRPLVLVVDQTRDDASVRFGALDAEGFLRLLDRALEENPDARVVVRTHPDVLAGKREGYLTDYAREKGVEVTAVADNPMDWLVQSARVYVGTSQLGFEALMCGCEVSVAGLPFYAGWGLTNDFQKLPRRRQKRSLDQIFHASYVFLAQYCDPVTGKHWKLAECIEHVLLQKATFKRNAHRYTCVGISAWKRRYLSQYLRSPDGQIRFSSKPDMATDERALFWSFKDKELFTTGLDQQNGVKDEVDYPISRMEDGFIRSRGLGSDFIAPASLIVDHSGLYFDPSASSDLESLLNTADCSLAQLQRARSIRKSLLSARLTKYNVGRQLSGSLIEPLTQHQKILVVGQVEDDQSIKRGCTDVASNTDLCIAVRAARPDAYIVYKPHPDVESGNRRGAVAEQVLAECIDHVEKERNFLDCLDYSDELHTMTSLSGFEALLRGKPVFTYGMPFYAGWGLTTDVVCCERRARRRNLDELIYLCLVAYPSYMDVASGEFITAEQLIEILRESHPSEQKKHGVFRRRWIKYRNVRRALRYNP